MQIAAVVIDTWKLPIFRRALDRACYLYTQHDDSILDTTILKIETNNMVVLSTIIQEINNEAARSRLN